MSNTMINNVDENVMKLLHYFITVQGYNPIVLHGAENEIWLENMDSDYKVVRIVSNYIHNDEQFKFDIYRTRQIVKRIKKQTFSFSINTLSIFINLGDNVSVDKFNNLNNIMVVDAKNIDDLKKYDSVMKVFPDITNETNFKETGMELFLKLTGDINKKNENENSKATDVFKVKKPLVTVSIIAVNTVLFLAMFFLSKGNIDAKSLVDFGALYKPYVLNGQYYRLITAAFVHVSVTHLVVNSYSLYIIGSQIESFLGRIKFIFIYFISALCGALMSMVFSSNVSAGASGAIFGLLGSLLYFGYNYRVYLGTVLKSQIIPLIIINLGLGFVISGVDNAAHIGGLIGGAIATMAVGLKYKSTRFEKVNGYIILGIYILFLGYMSFIR